VEIFSISQCSPFIFHKSDTVASFKPYVLVSTEINSSKTLALFLIRHH
jgi:hypothetical protein